MKIFSTRKWLLDLLRIFSFLRHGWSKLRNHALDLKDIFSEFHASMWHAAAEELSVQLKRYPGGFYKASYGDRA